MLNDDGHDDDEDVWHYTRSTSRIASSLVEFFLQFS